MTKPRIRTGAAPEDREYYRTHLVYAPGIIEEKIRSSQPGARRILDFGCGQGVMTLGVALAFPDAEVVGVDIHSAFERAAEFCARVLDRRLPDNLRYRRIEPGQSVGEAAKPDVIYSWSVMEHVPRPLLPGVIADLFASVRDGGIVLTQICPLYFSPHGSHLQGFIAEPWAHLTLSHEDLRRRVSPDPQAARTPESAPWMFAHYEELNRITADELWGYFMAAGFRGVQDIRRSTDLAVPPHLASAYTEAALKVEELFFIHRRPGSPQPEVPAVSGFLARMLGRR
jgi:SAM-dependent methyltransferase